MKKILKSLSVVCVFVLVVSTLMLFSTSAFAYSGTGDYDDPIQISTFVDGDPLPDGEDAFCYVNDLPYTIYMYTDYEWADLYICINDQPPFDYAERRGEYEPGEWDSWYTEYCNQFDEHPIMRIFLCGHNVTAPVDAKDPTCAENGVKAHYQCQGCGWLFNDEAATSRIYDEKSVIIPSTDHSIEAVGAKDATCTEDGMKAHYHCTACNKLFSDEAGTTEVAKDKLVIPATGHVSKVLPGKAATYDATGLTDGEICETCGTILVEQKVIPKLEKNADPEKKPEKESPDTSDVSVLYICLAFALVSVASASFMLKRKHSM